MYLFFIILLSVLFLFFCINHRRKKKNIQKVRDMCMDDKCRLLNELIGPFGYSYILSQDIFTSRVDAWQREFGYCKLYDDAATHFHMIFDCLPVYFNYQGRTWLLEFWKGQYGISTGCEIGMYYADHILHENELDNVLFQAVDDSDMLQFSFKLSGNNEHIASLNQTHWWLTAFRPGYFSEPSDLFLHASIAFPSCEMLNAFLDGLHTAGWAPENVCCCCNTVTLSFAHSTQRISKLRQLRGRLAQWQNHFWCKVYLFITRPFTLSIDRILYLYFYLPFAFRRTLRIRRYKK